MHNTQSIAGMLTGLAVPVVLALAGFADHPGRDPARAVQVGHQAYWNSSKPGSSSPTQDQLAREPI